MNKQKKTSGKSKGVSDAAIPVVRRLQSVEASDDHLAANNSATSLNGTYMNACFVRAFFAIYGREVEVTVKNGAVYHGILYSMSERGEILLKCVHRILGPGDDCSQAVTNPSKSTLEEFIAFTSDLIVQMVCKNVSLQPPAANNESCTFHNKPHGNDNNHVNGTRYSEGGASASFLTDTEVSGVSAHRGGAVNSSNQGTAATYVNGVDNGSVHMERELTPWCPEGTDANNCDDELFDTLDDHACNGWTAEDMLKTNRENCGVEDCEYDESKYTLPLDKNSEEYQKNLHWANEKAREMQECTDYSRLLLEKTIVTGGEEEDEEAIFSAVDRRDASGDAMSHRSPPSCNNSSITSSTTTPPTQSNNAVASANNSLLSSNSANINLRDFTTVHNKRNSNRSGRGASGGYPSGSIQQHGPVPLINNSNSGTGGLPQRSNYRAGKHTGANMGPAGSGGAGSGPGLRSGAPGTAASSGNNAPRRFVSSHNQQKTANALQQQTFNSTGANNVSNQPQFGYTDNSAVTQTHSNKQGQSYGGTNSQCNSASGAPVPNQGRVSKEQNLKNFSKNIQLRDSPASQSNKIMSSGPSAAAVAKTNQVASPLCKQHAYAATMASSPNLSPNTRPELNSAADGGGGSNAIPAQKHSPPQNAWNRPPQIHNNTAQIPAPNTNLCGAGAGSIQQLPRSDVNSNCTTTSHGLGSLSTITRSNSVPSNNMNNSSSKPTGQPGSQQPSKKRSNDNSGSSEKFSSDTTAACAKEGRPSECGEGAKEPVAEHLDATLSQNDTSLSSVPSVTELSFNEDETEIVKNSKLNVKAQEFKPSGNFFSPNTSQQETSEDSPSAMFAAAGAAGLTVGVPPHMYYSPQNSTPMDNTVVSTGVMSPHFGMMATVPAGSHASVAQTHPHASTGSNGGCAEETQAQALVASNVPYAAAGPPHLPQLMHLAPHAQYPFAGMPAGMGLHGQPMPGPGGNSGAPATVNMFQAVPQVPLQHVSTPAPHLQAGVPAIAPRHITPFGPHVPVSGHGISVQFAAPIIPHHPNVGASSGVPNSSAGVGSGVATLNTSSPTFQTAKQYRTRGNFRNATPNSHFFLQNNNTAASVSSLGGATGQHVPMQASGATSAGGVSQMPYHPVLNPSNGSNTAGGPFPYHQGPLIAAAQGLYPTPVALTSVVGPPPTAHQQQNLSHSASQQLSLGQSANSSVSNVGSSAGATVSAQQQQTNSQQIPALTVAGGTPGVGVMANYFPHPGGHHNTVTVPSMYQSSIYNQQVRMTMQPHPHGVVLDHGVANITPQFVAQTIAATGPAAGAGGNQPQPGLVGTPGSAATGGGGPNMAAAGGGQAQSAGAANSYNSAANFSQQHSQDYAVSYPPLPSTNTHSINLGLGVVHQPHARADGAANNSNDHGKNAASQSISHTHTSPPPILASTGSSDNKDTQQQPSGTILASTGSMSRRESASNKSSGGSGKDNNGTPYYQYQPGQQQCSSGTIGVMINSPRGSRDSNNAIDSFVFMESLPIPLLSTVLSAASNNNPAMLSPRDSGGGFPALDLSGGPLSVEMAVSANNPAISGSTSIASVTGQPGAASGSNGGNENAAGANGSSSGAPPGTTNGGLVPAPGVVMPPNGPVTAVQAHAAAQQLAAAVAANRNSQIAAAAGAAPAGHAGGPQAAHPSYPFYMIMHGAAQAQAQNMLHAQAAAVQQAQQMQLQQQQEHHHRNSLSGQGAVDYAVSHRGQGGAAPAGQDINNRGD